MKFEYNIDPVRRSAKFGVSAARKSAQKSTILHPTEFSETGFWSAKYAKFQPRWTLKKPDSESRRSPRECQKYFKSGPGGVPEHHFDPSRTRSGGRRRFVGNWKSWTLSIILTTFRSRTQKIRVRNEVRGFSILNPPERFGTSARADCASWSTALFSRKDSWDTFLRYFGTDKIDFQRTVHLIHSFLLFFFFFSFSL